MSLQRTEEPLRVRVLHAASCHWGELAAAEVVWGEHRETCRQEIEQRIGVAIIFAFIARCSTKHSIVTCPFFGGFFKVRVKAIYRSRLLNTLIRGKRNRWLFFFTRGKMEELFTSKCGVMKVIPSWCAGWKGGRGHSIQALMRATCMKVKLQLHRQPKKKPEQ